MFLSDSIQNISFNSGTINDEITKPFTGTYSSVKFSDLSCKQFFGLSKFNPSIERSLKHKHSGLEKNGCPLPLASHKCDQLGSAVHRGTVGIRLNNLLLATLILSEPGREGGG